MQSQMNSRVEILHVFETRESGSRQLVGMNIFTAFWSFKLSLSCSFIHISSAEKSDVFSTTFVNATVGFELCRHTHRHGPENSQEVCPARRHHRGYWPRLCTY